MTGPFKSGYVAIIGWPNVGKSTLLNAFLGAKLSIVSTRPQTTREAILGILNEPQLQMVFVDTPGWLSPQDNFQAFMKRAIMRTVYDDADILVWLLEPKPFMPEDAAFAETLKKTKIPVIVAINKVDMAKSPADLDKLEKEIRQVLGEEAPVVRISAKTGQGVWDLKGMLQARLPESPPYFPTDQITDRWERFYVAELIREQIFKKFQQEVPHACAVVIEDFVEKHGRKDVIKASLVVETEGQKQIVVGKAGSAIRDLGQAARTEIEAQLGRPVYLEMVVKIRKHWRQDTEFLKSLLAL